jgi:hypothetical protein
VGLLALPDSVAKMKCVASKSCRLAQVPIVTIDACPACGYPTIGPDLCSYCRPEAQTNDRMFEPMLFATTLRVSAVRGNEQGELPWQTMNAVAL